MNQTLNSRIFLTVAHNVQKTTTKNKQKRENDDNNNNQTETLVTYLTEGSAEELHGQGLSR